MSISEPGQLTFDEFLALMTEMDKQKHSTTDSQRIEQHFRPDDRIKQFLNLLEEYRRKCEQDSNYAEANKAAWKIKDIKEKEQQRQR